MKQLVMAALLGAIVTSVAFAKPPRHRTSQYLQTTGAGFVVDSGKVRYNLKLAVSNDTSGKLYLELKFENPANKVMEIISQQTVPENATEIAVTSPALGCVRNNRRYRVRIKVYADLDALEPISEHYQKVEMRIPKQQIESQSVELC